MPSLNPFKWPNLSEQMTAEEVRQRQIDAYYKQLMAQGNAISSTTSTGGLVQGPINTTGSAPWVNTTTTGIVGGVYVNPPMPPVPADAAYYKKISEDMAKGMNELRQANMNMHGRAVRAERELEGYKGLIPWLMENHPDYIEEFTIFLKTIERLEIDKE